MRLVVREDLRVGQARVRRAAARRDPVHVRELLRRIGAARRGAHDRVVQIERGAPEAHEAERLDRAKPRRAALSDDRTRIHLDDRADPQLAETRRRHVGLREHRRLDRERGEARDVLRHRRRPRMAGAVEQHRRDAAVGKHRQIGRRSRALGDLRALRAVRARRPDDGSRAAAGSRGARRRAEQCGRIAIALAAREEDGRGHRGDSLGQSAGAANARRVHDASS